MKMFTAVYKDKLQSRQKAQTERNSKLQKKQKIDELKSLQKHKQLKRMVYKRLGQMESRKTKANARRGKSAKNDSIDE